MELTYLKEFTVLAQTGNFMEAAELLFISQSTLSKHIKSLETELNTPLFHRTTRKVELSQYGELMLPYAKKIVQLQNDYTGKLLSVLEKEQNCLQIGSIPALAQYNITKALVDFKKECAHIQFNVVQTGTAQLKELLRSGKCELAFIRETEQTEDDLVRIPYDTDCLVAVLPQNHPLGGKSAISLAELQHEEFLLIEKGTMLYDLCYSACKQWGFEPKIAFTDHKVEHLLDFVQKGMGIALLAKKLALYPKNYNITVADLSPLVPTQISLSYKKGAKLSAAAKHFIMMVRQQKLSVSRP